MRVAVLCSGSGTNLQALIDAADPLVEIVLVLSDKPEAAALDRARNAAIETRVEPWAGDRAEFTGRICRALETAQVELVVLAGFMRILGPEAVERFSGRIVNVHPSLLPAFPGGHAVADALESGVETTGVSVHVVDELVDHGPLLAQENVPVVPGDTVETLHARIQQVEHRLYPRVVAAIARGELKT